MLPARETLLARLTDVLAPLPVRFAVLYGSHAAGRPTPISDLDVAVYVEGLAEWLGVIEAVEDGFPGVRVDVVNLKGKPALFYYEVLRSGEAFLVKDEALFQAEKFRVMREYLDLKPLYERLFKDMMQRIDDGTYGQPAGPPQGVGGESA